MKFQNEKKGLWNRRTKMWQPTDTSRKIQFASLQQQKSKGAIQWHLDIYASAQSKKKMKCLLHTLIGFLLLNSSDVCSPLLGLKVVV